MTTAQLKKSIQASAEKLGTTWPLYSFVTSNPLGGYENLPFDEALKQARKRFGASTYPSASMFRQAWMNGELDPQLLENKLKAANYNEDPAHYLEILEHEKPDFIPNPHHEVDHLLTKWLAAFLDEGLAEWSMPNRESGFYQSWKTLAPHDDEIPGREKISRLPEAPLQTIKEILNNFSLEERDDAIAYHLNALPGWVGYIKYRIESNTEWQQAYPIRYIDYLAVRLALVSITKAPLVPHQSREIKNSDDLNIARLWLEAWEETWQQRFIYRICEEMKIETSFQQPVSVPKAQLVFCIDTRSERIRRHIEAQGSYQTFGYAGFFGIPMRYKGYRQNSSVTSCPPILKPAFQATENLNHEKKEEKNTHDKRKNLTGALKSTFKSLKNTLPAAFGFVEGAGILYGSFILLKTLWPDWENHSETPKVHEAFCEPQLTNLDSDESPADEISSMAQADIVKAAFELMGWNEFAPLVVFTGHESNTANNPFASSLDCGACAGNTGRHNARLLATMGNDDKVRFILSEKYGYDIPENTLFVGAVHNTTTDEITLFDDHLPETHKQELEELKADLQSAQIATTAERMQSDTGEALAMAKQKAANWSETRPEWGLAGNAGFIIGPRRYTKNLHLNGESFLHSYDWQKDEQGRALEAIMQGPLTVTQWINNHYYFSLVDNETFGSGSKITHNLTSTFGVVQGNSGDLKRGLPLQSLQLNDEDIQHRPLRLTTLIFAPLERVEAIIKRNEDSIKQLLDNRWMYLKVICPERNYSLFSYKRNMEWDCDRTNDRICKDSAKLVT